jgi:hypothetical protein
MSYGDINKFSIPTVYKGMQMRSKLETKIALLLDYLKIKWEYEPKTFQLSSGIMYKPDFYLPEHKQWIEVKGVIGNNNLEISKTFVKDTKQEIILISSREIYYFEYLNNWKECNWESSVWMQIGMQIGKCSKCKTYFFTPLYGSYHCRKCGNHEGDHDIVAGINSGNGCWGDEIDFSSIKMIKLWLEDHGTKI